MRRIIARAFTTLLRRTSRNLLTLIAIVLSGATLAALLGITTSSAAQTASRFNQMESPVITASLPASQWDVSEDEILQRLESFTLIKEAGTLNLPQDMSTVVDISAPQWGITTQANVSIATRQGLAARQATIVSGTTPTQGPLATHDPYTAMLGARLAGSLGISMEQTDPIITVNGIEFAVTGILKDSDTQSMLATAVVLSPESARILGPMPTSRNLHILVADNSAEAVGQHLQAALFPTDTNQVSLSYPSNPRKLRESLMADSAVLTFITAGIMLVVSTFSIINTMLIAIAERRKEIGITMALGLGRREIALQFLVESMLLGVLGATVGMLLGCVIVGGVSVFGGWPFMIPVSVLLIPLFGLVIGALAGLVPAWRASRVNPAELLRSV